jgi:hypothetical protein
MADLFKTLPAGEIEKERIKGAQISVNFRWIFILLILCTTYFNFFIVSVDNSTFASSI